MKAQWCKLVERSMCMQLTQIYVETYMNVYGMLHDSTNQCAQYKLKIVYKIWQQKHSGEHIFFNKIKIINSHVVLLEDFPIHVSFTIVGLILTKLGWFLEVRTDRHDFGILKWKNVGAHKISTQSSKLGVSCRSLFIVCKTYYNICANEIIFKPSIKYQSHPK